MIWSVTGHYRVLGKINVFIVNINDNSKKGDKAGKRLTLHDPKYDLVCRIYPNFADSLVILPLFLVIFLIIYLSLIKKSKNPTTKGSPKL